MKPLFITVEGLDGSGKSSHLRWVSEWLGQHRHGHIITHEPGGTALGESIRGVFLQEAWTSVDGIVEALLVFASRRQHLLEVIEPALAKGCHVLCDRFTDSTFAYQGHGRGVSLPILRRIDQLATGGRVPDRTLLFDLHPGMARSRGQSPSRRAGASGVDRLDAEELGFYERVREGYLELARSDPERFSVVDSSGTVESTRGRVLVALEAWFGRRS